MLLAGELGELALLGSGEGVALSPARWGELLCVLAADAAQLALGLLDALGKLLDGYGFAGHVIPPVVGFYCA